MCCCNSLIKAELSQYSGVSYTDNTAPQAGRESSITHTPQHTPTHSFCSSLSFHKVTLTLPSSGGKNPSLRPRALTATIPGRNCLTHAHMLTHTPVTHTHTRTDTHRQCGLQTKLAFKRLNSQLNNKLPACLMIGS